VVSEGDEAEPGEVDARSGVIELTVMMVSAGVEGISSLSLPALTGPI